MSLLDTGIDYIDNIKFKIANRSIYFLVIIFFRIVGFVEALLSYNVLGFLFGLFITYKLWNKNKLWRDVVAFLEIPVTLFIGFATSKGNLASEMGLIFGSIILIVLFAKCWNEFTVGYSLKQELLKYKYTEKG